MAEIGITECLFGVVYGSSVLVDGRRRAALVIRLCAAQEGTFDIAG